LIRLGIILGSSLNNDSHGPTRRWLPVHPPSWRALNHRSQTMDIVVLLIGIISFAAFVAYTSICETL